MLPVTFLLTFPNLQVVAAILDLLPSANKRPVGVEGLRIFLLLNELLYTIQKHNRQKSSRFAETVAAAVLSLSPESLQIIGTTHVPQYNDAED